MKRTFFLTSVILLTLSVSAQTQSEIDKYNGEVNEKIKSSIENGYEGTLYNNHWITNKNGASWPAVGIYEANTDFWYNAPPELIDDNEKPVSVLLKVSANHGSTSYKHQAEYLFKKGNLVLFSSRLDEGGDILETQYYFNEKGTLIKEIIRFNEKVVLKSDAALNSYTSLIILPNEALEKGKKYQDVFLLSM